MKKLVLLVLSAGLLAYVLLPQWDSYDRMGLRRFHTLEGPQKEILVGVCWPFSVNQDGMADGLQLAQEEINRDGLAGGIPFRLVNRDDAFDWERGKRIAVEFARNRHMSAVVGYYDDSVGIKASAIFESAKLLHIITGANATSMTARGFDYIVRTTLSNDKIARDLAMMSNKRGYKKYALIWERNAYGEDLAYQYHISMDEYKAALLYQRSYSRERPDFRLIVNELKGIDADVIFFAGLEPWAGDFLRQARIVGVRPDIIGAFSNTPEMRQRAGRALEGSMYFEMYDVNSPSPENQEFIHKFRARFGRLPDTWAAQGYDALRLLANAVRFTGSANPLDLSYAIRYMAPWEGANGRYQFDSRGDMGDKPLYLNVYRNLTPVTIQQSYPAAAAQ